MLMDEVEKGLADVIAGRTGDTREHLKAIKARRAKRNAASEAAS
jgi:predicted transcriptional regulator